MKIKHFFFPFIVMFIVATLSYSCKETIIEEVVRIDTVEVTVIDTVFITTTEVVDSLIYVNVSDTSQESRILNMTAEIEGVTYHAIIDQELHEILIEVPGEVSLDTVQLLFQDQRLVESGGFWAQKANLNEPVLLSFKSIGSTLIRDYIVSIFSSNLIANSNAMEGTDSWSFCSNCGVEEVENNKFAFYNFGIENSDASIRQTFELPDNFKLGYILFIGNLWTDSVSNETITGRPYLWAQQNGDLGGAWPFMQGMAHESGSNEWQKVRGIHELLLGVESILFKMSQSSHATQSYFGSKNLFMKIEARVFTSPRGASIYAEKLFE